MWYIEAHKHIISQRYTCAKYFLSVDITGMPIFSNRGLVNGHFRGFILVSINMEIFKE